jgi:hypothetical protein
MKDLSRLLDEPGTDPLEADLLRLARREGPSSAGRQRILAGVAVAAAAGAVSSASAAAAKGTSAVEAVPSRAALKWAIFGAVGVGTAALALLVSGHHAPKTVSAPANSARPAASLTAPLPPEPAPEPAPAPELSPVTKLEDLPRLSSSADSVHTAPAPSLADEVAAIKAAKSALLAGNASEALHQLDAYRARFPRGRLTQEASVVRIEALLKSGNRSAASAAGDRFLAAHADSPYAARVHTLIGH